MLKSSQATLQGNGASYDGEGHQKEAIVASRWYLIARQCGTIMMTKIRPVPPAKLADFSRNGRKECLLRFGSKILKGTEIELLQWRKADAAGFSFYQSTMRKYNLIMRDLLASRFKAR